jgi:nucleotide-binding universal stress UspA family protein
MYTRVLVPLDGSSLAEQILPFARLWAEALHIPLALLWVNDPAARPPLFPSQDDTAYLRRIAARFPPSLQLTHATKSGNPAAVIIDTAREDPACVIAMATHGLSGIRRWLLGSVTSKVVQQTQNPLLLVRPVEGSEPAASVEIRTIFVALDGSPLAETILPHVAFLARQFEAQVHLVQVYSVPANAYVFAEGFLPPGTDQYQREAQSAANLYLESKAQALYDQGIGNAVATAVLGDAAAEIIDIARKTSNNMIAMCTHGRSGIGRWLLGSVAEKVIQHSGDPILLVRPRNE